MSDTSRLALSTTFNEPGIVEGVIDDADASLYADGGERDDHIYDLMDIDNDCDHPGGHLFMGDCLGASCVHCRKRV